MLLVPSRVSHTQLVERISCGCTEYSLIDIASCAAEILSYIYCLAILLLSSLIRYISISTVEMNLTTSLLALAGQNLSSTLQAPGGYVFCSEFYGSYYKRKDCIKAINLLEKGTTEIPYAVQGDIGPHALPLSKSYGQSHC